MKAQKTSSLRDLKMPELEQKLEEVRENFFKLRVRKETRQLEDLASLRVARREVAKVETVLKQKKAAEAASATKESKANG